MRSSQTTFVQLALISLAALLAASTFFYIRSRNNSNISEEVQKQFVQFQLKYGKSYGNPKESNYRLKVFNKNYKHIKQTNAQSNNYKLAVNKFADLTKEEFLAKYTGFRPTPVERRTYRKSPRFGRKKSQPIDWRTLGAVTPIKNQGRCGSCWAFSTTGAIEALYFNTRGKLISLSEQQLVDCTTTYDNAGCNGGWMDWAMHYVKDFGIELESDYPYQARNGRCHPKSSEFIDLKLTGYEFVKGGEDELEQAVQDTTVSIALNADPLMFYSSGIIDSKCDPSRLTHAVLVVGWGVDQRSGKQYWIVKNSWGTSWGEEGYFRIVKGHTSEGHCGLASHAVYPTA